MKKLLVLLTIAICMHPGVIFADSHVAVVKSQVGDCRILRHDKSIYAKKGIKLLNSDVIQTERGAFLGVIFNDGTSVTVGPNTELNIQNYVFEPNIEKYDFSFYLKRGSALFNSGKISKLSPKSVRIKTATAMVGIKGTRFIVEVQE